MLRRISALVVLVVAVALVWRWVRDGSTQPASHSATPLVHAEPSPASPGDAAPPSRSQERVESAREDSAKPPPATSPASTLPTLQGRLDDVVPRPVLDGRVRVRLDRAGAQGDRDFEAVVRADGTFELAGLPPGHGQIAALCRGWVSLRTPFDAIEKVALRLGRAPTMGEIEQAFQEEGVETLEAQRVVVPSRAPLVVAMQRTGALAVSVRAQDGAPLAGAVVSVSPSVRWNDGTILPWGERQATTDAQGRARIDDLPPDDALAVEARHDSFRLKRADDARPSSVAIVSGRTAELELVFLPKED